MPVLFILSAMRLSGRAFVIDNFHVTGRKMTVWQVVIIFLSLLLHKHITIPYLCELFVISLLSLLPPTQSCHFSF